MHLHNNVYHCMEIKENQLTILVEIPVFNYDLNRVYMFAFLLKMYSFPYPQIFLSMQDIFFIVMITIKKQIHH